MTAAAVRALLVIACALLAGSIWQAVTGHVPGAVALLSMAILAGVLAALLATAWGGRE